MVVEIKGEACYEERIVSFVSGLAKEEVRSDLSYPVRSRGKEGSTERLVKSGVQS